MKKLTAAVFLAATLGAPMTANALSLPEVPTSYCALMAFLGFQNVKECEGPSS